MESTSEVEKHIPSFFQNSCPGNSAEEVNSEATFRQLDVAVEKSAMEKNGWITSLLSMPNVSNQNLVERLIGSSVMMDKEGKAPKAYRNKKHGYKLWKEGYICCVLVKPNVMGNRLLFPVKAKVCASMKNIQYDVYVHLDQENGDAVYAKCSCKAGKGGCCKHVAALLYTLVDYSNLDLKEILGDLTCTQVGQKWHIPADAKRMSSKAVKIKDISFEKAEEGTSKKRQILTGERQGYCAVPLFAWDTGREELLGLTKKLRLAGKASLFCEALESNEFQPCSLFDTSCSRALNQSESDKAEQETTIEHLAYIMGIYDNMPKTMTDDESLPRDQSFSAVYEKVGVSIVQSIEICKNTIMQSSEPIWYLERSKRITASIFGRVLKRRQAMYPASIIRAITEKASVPTRSVPLAMKWGIEHENDAVNQYVAIHPLLTVKKCGFIINPQWPWLGCSPDGIVFENDIAVGCIEVKCPYSKRDMTIKEAADNDNTFFMKNIDSIPQLKHNHCYYYQCQGVLNILGLEWIDFVIYALRGIHVERIMRDETLWRTKMLPMLTDFFFKYIFPRI